MQEKMKYGITTTEGSIGIIEEFDTLKEAEKLVQKWLDEEEHEIEYMILEYSESIKIEPSKLPDEYNVIGFYK